MTKHQAKLEEYERHLNTLGRRNSYSKTDPDATFMRMKEDHMGNGQLKPAYNVQISTENQFITNFGIYQNPGDTPTLIDYLSSFEEKYRCQSAEVVADSGYGSEQNYDYLEAHKIGSYVKFSFFHKEQRRAFKSNPFLADNLFYSPTGNFYVCPMGQRLELVGEYRRVSDRGYESKVSAYQAIQCEGCPLRGSCHQAKGNRRIEVNHNLQRHKTAARANLTSGKGLMHRSRRPIEPEAALGQIKSNKKFNRFHLKGLEGVTVEFGLISIALNLSKMMKRLRDQPKVNLKTVKSAVKNQIILLLQNFFDFISKILKCYQVSTSFR